MIDKLARQQTAQLFWTSPPLAMKIHSLRTPVALIRPLLPLLGLLLCGLAARPAWAADKAPWLMTAEERVAYARHSEELQGLQREANKAGTKPTRPTVESLARMRTELVALQAQLAELPKDEYGLPPADAAIYAEAVELQLKNDDWPGFSHEPNTFACLAWGRAVVAGMKADSDFMRRSRGLVPVGYRSAVDRSAQMYQVLLPEGFDPTTSGPHRLIVNLHGASAIERPVTWIATTPNRAKDLNVGAITVRPYGRGNNGYVWTAESDVWDVIADVKKRYAIDEDQVVLSGFSMGGGGTMALGLTHPGPFAAISPLAPAARSATTMPTAKELPVGPQRWAPLSETEIAERVNRVYAGIALAENGLGVPVMLGCGGDDGLLRVQESLAQAFNATKVKYSAFVLAGVGHAGDTVGAQPQYRQFLLAHRRNPPPREVTFATASLKSASRAWIAIEGLTAHYTKAKIHAVADPEKGTLTVTTDGIERFTLTPPESLARRGKTTVNVDGENVTGATLSFEKADGKWREARGAVPALSKHPGLQGPIGDAFTRPFLCVRPTGATWNEAANGYALEMLETLRTNWRTQQHGELPVKDDTAVTAADRASFDLILFGDPGSNRLIAETLAAKSPWALPLHWDKNSVTLGGSIFAADTHVPALIYPSPLAAGRYVVLNGVPLARGLGWLRDGEPSEPNPLRALPATLGDFAILQVGRSADGKPGAKSVHGGFFNEAWR
jgi:pimeloyl-ACP methyl ester carboxylesterase